MKKYILGLILSIVSLLVPFGLLILCISNIHSPYIKYYFGACIVSALIYFMTRNAISNLLADGRQNVEYDEFGRSKRKGDFKKLSRAEQDAIDLQKTADLERILSASVIAKITKEGSKNPEKDLEEMIGMNDVKTKVKEMSARMKFEKESNKGKKKKDQINSMSGRHMVFYGSAGTGKAQPLYSKILTPRGFVKMGDIKTGDFVISGTNRVAKVLGVFPQGKKDIYEITFDDGSKCRCSDEHLWTVQTDKDRQNKKENVYRTIELKEMLDNLKVKHGNVERKNYSVDYVEQIEFEQKDFYIHPYLLGLLIGDGNLEKNSVSISLYDEQLRKDIYNFFPNEQYEITLKSSKHPNIHDYSIKYNGLETYHYPENQKKANLKPLNYHLALLGLRGCKSDEKFIPKEYLYASIEQRKWLLKGLLDTDGYAEEGYIEYSTTSIQLKDDIIELVHSLGGYASFKEKQGSYTKQGKHKKTKKYYRISIHFPLEYKDCFNLDRKKAKYNPKRSREVMKRYIANIEYIGKEECQCIYIDDPSHLYITDNYIITHNTTVARIITGFLYQYGYIKKNKCVEVDGNFLKAGSETATKVKMITQYAYDGVLFIDEAYVLCEGAYGNEAVATLIKEMEDNRDRFICILAGYTKDMNRLLDSNTGFKSRIKEYLNFPDYSIPEMKDIFMSMANSNGFAVADKALDNLEIRLGKEKQLKTFGNGRTVRNLLDEALDKHSLNYVSKQIPENDRYRICGKDVSVKIKNNGIT